MFRFDIAKGEYTLKGTGSPEMYAGDNTDT
jgi:hypothetical protein